MPRNIKVIDIEDTVQPITIDEEPPASEEEPAQIVMEVEPVVVDEPEQTVEVPVKKKRATKPKKQLVYENTLEAIPEPVEVAPEPVEVVVKPMFVLETDENFEALEKPEEPEKTEETKNTKVIEQVPCPDCGKKMTARTLKYSHADICPVKFPKQPRKQSERRKIAQGGAEVVTDARVKIATERIARINQPKETFKTLFAQAL